MAPPGTAGRIVAFFGLVVLLVWPLALLGLPGLWGSHGPLLMASLLAGWAMLALESRGPGALGFPWGRSGLVELGVGTAVGTGVVLAVILAMTGSGGIRWGVGSAPLPEALLDPLTLLVLLSLPAAAEEALLRGYVFQASAERWGWGWTLAWTSGAFALIHMANPGIGALPLVNLALAGVVLGLVVLRTGSLWWATGAHLGWNWGQAALGLPVSGLHLVPEPLLEPVLTGASWQGGGTFGVEGTTASLVVLSAAAVWLWQGGGGGWMAPRREVMAAGSPVLAGEAGQTLARKGLLPPGMNPTE
jgi:uncharacterized protein